MSEEAFDLSVLASASVSRLPKRLDGCAYDPAERSWVPRAAIRKVPKEARGQLLRGFTHQAEKARSGAAACKRCGAKIPKDALRIGYATKDHRGEYGALVQWFDLSCARVDDVIVGIAGKGAAEMKQRVVGFDELSLDEQDDLCKQLLQPWDAATEAAAAAATLAVAPPRQLYQHQAPPALLVSMLPFQAEGLGWLLAREADRTTCGGILADEMGMGKTLQTIALLLASPSEGPTLVVCPAAAMLQWHNEIARFTQPGSLGVHLYYGFDRKHFTLPSQGKVVVLTTYQTLEADYRRVVNKHKTQCEWCGRFFLPEKLAFHQKYFCGPDAERTEKQQLQEKKDLKSEAVKKMKIGGTETNITLNPLTALRKSTLQLAAHRRLRKGPPNAEPAAAGLGESSSNGMASTATKPTPVVMPFPVSVLPPEAQEALGCRAGGGELHCSKRLAQRGQSSNGRGRGGKRPVEPPLETSPTALTPSSLAAEATMTPAPNRGRKRYASGENLKADIYAETMMATATPAKSSSSPPVVVGAATQDARRRWHGLVSPKLPTHTDIDAPDVAKCEQISVSVETCKKTTLVAKASWGKMLSKRQLDCVFSTTSTDDVGCVVAATNGTGVHRVIALDGVEDSGSDLELLHASNTGVGFKGGLWASSSASARMGGRNDTGSVAQASMTEAEADEALRPESDGEADIDLSSSLLFRTKWARIVLDEAHRIKGRTNSTAQAAFALQATDARWCLSGTPLQNRVGELYAMIRFLRFFPYAHYFCNKKGCKCISLHYRFDADDSKCKKCGHTKMQHRSHFANFVTNPIKKFGFLSAGRTAMENLRTDVLDRLLLRRTKLERQEDVNLPPLTIQIRKDALSPEERDFYTSMFTQSRTQFDTFVDRGTILHNYAHVFDLIMRLRQAVDHPYLIVHGSIRTSEKGPLPTKSRGDAAVCSLCQDDVDDVATRVLAQCGHAFHRDCVTEYLEESPELPSGGIGCPTCFRPLTVNLDEAVNDEHPPLASLAGTKSSTGGIMQQIKSSEFKTSTKIEALLQELLKMQAADAASKALVFSQFTKMLELIEFRLKREGISAAKLIGTMPIVSRNNIIISFQTDPSLKVLLISLKAGGEGLNLQAADHIFVMDPWWNPAAESQAIQRAHRIGQRRPVKALRFITEDTIEEKIVELQQKKQTVFDCTVGSSNVASQKLTAEDIQFLFS